MQSYKLFGTTRLARGFHITKKEKILMYNEVHEFSPFAILAHQTVKVQDLELIA